MAPKLAVATDMPLRKSLAIPLVLLNTRATCWKLFVLIRFGADAKRWTAPFVSVIFAKSDPRPPRSGIECQRCTPTPPLPEFHSAMGCCEETSLGLIQHSIVNPSPAPTSSVEGAI